MIVFSVTHAASGKIFVGSARDSMDATWAQLLTQAEDGAGGDFFALARADGAESFKLEEWAFAEDSRELRELVREAQQELGAEPIKASRGSSAAVKRVQDAIRLEFAEVGEDAEEPLEDWLSARRESASTTAAVQKTTSTTGAVRPTVGKAAASAGVDRIASGRSGSASKEKRIKEAIAEERDSRDQHRHTRSTEEAAEMRAVMAAIENRRQGNKKSTKKKPAKARAAKSTTGASKVGAASKQTSTLKLAQGRTGSSTKEKRIKEAIAAEKAARDAQAKSKVSSQADEMAEILARLDARTVEANKIRRRR